MKRPLLLTGTASGVIACAFVLLNSLPGCRPSGTTKSVVTGDAASKVYVKPGTHDEFYNLVSGGFSGQLAVYGLPSGRLLREVPVFSVDPETGYGYSEETKGCLLYTSPSPRD